MTALAPATPQVPRPARTEVHDRPAVRGKFLYAGADKLWVRGVTYGTFRPVDGDPYSPDRVNRDFAQMAAAGLNAVRTYDTPPRWLLDAAARHGLRVMVGLPWEQHVAFLDERGRRRSIADRVREAVQSVAGHPALLCYAVGNEIPGSIVRWLGARRVESFLADLAAIVRAGDPGGLVTYVNFPTTEYLDLSFADVVTFNVYLEERGKYDAYLARLQNIAGDKPLLMAEIGLDSRRNGETVQASSVEWQVRSSFAAGCAGAFVFAWTDEWHRGGFDIEDWDFGLVRRDRTAKPALDAVTRAFTEVPFPADRMWPRISVVVCSYNGARTIRDCLEGLARVDYPDFEVIVVNDGSTDATSAIAAEYDVRLISTENRGLSAARNTGMEAATGEIVAYTDDDARPDPHWLRYLAHAYMTTDHVAMGGPNIAPPEDGPLAECVANAPGGPIHVLVADQLAEHVPGCNLSVRRSALAAVGGFDPVYRTAGDDVDCCWRLQEAGGTIGFHAGAMVWHHRRGSIRMYWKQQQGYGKAEALLERKWPDRYNALGHLAWAGQLYGRGITAALVRRGGLIYGGSGGAAPFQRMYEPAVGLLSSLPLMPEWYLSVPVLLLLSLVGMTWTPLLAAIPMLGVVLGLPVAQAALSGVRAQFRGANGRTRGERLRMRAIVAFLHFIQPLARLRGRLAHGLTPWRRRGRRGLAIPRPRSWTAWSETWQSPDARLDALRDELRSDGAVVLRGGDFDAWDLEVRGGTLASARAKLAVEDHGGGRQLIRHRIWPRLSPIAVASAAVLGALAAWALRDGALLAGAVLAGLALVLVARVAYEAAAAAGSFVRGTRT